MTPKEILDSFSETLMRDDRILSGQERSLLAAVLQHANVATGQATETQNAVRTVIASAVGETVAQRAFSVLGASIVERILASSTPLPTVHSNFQTDLQNNDPPIRQSLPRTERVSLGSTLGNNPPAPEPQPPRPGPGVKAPHKPPHAPLRDPSPPSPSPSPIEPQPPRYQPQGTEDPIVEPQPPRGAIDTAVECKTTAAVAELPSVLPARCVVLDEFLAPQELSQLMAFALDHESDFRTSEVVSPELEGGVVNYEHRRSRVLTDLGQHQAVILQRIRALLPDVIQKLGMDEFSIAGVEAQMTASNDGDFFHFHSDNGSERVASRYLTFVYFFHREPRPFEGGELRIHDARLEGKSYASQGSYQTIVPRQNQIVFFPCELLHEITPVSCLSGQFADSRFTLNGWLRH